MKKHFIRRISNVIKHSTLTGSALIHTITPRSVILIGLSAIASYLAVIQTMHHITLVVVSYACFNFAIYRLFKNYYNQEFKQKKDRANVFVNSVLFLVLFETTFFYLAKVALMSIIFLKLKG